jgi:hypothetical protein
VRHVEHAGAQADGAVLLDDRLVLDRHLETGEGNEPSPESEMAIVERRPPERLHGRKSH